MSLFKDMLNEGETLFTPNIEALDLDYLPKVLPFREREQRTVAGCIKPLFQKQNGRNVLVYGKPGIGKTAAVKHLSKEIEEETDDIFAIYINCWQKNTSFKVMVALCDALGYKFTQNKKTEELAAIITDIINKNQGAVFVFDEIDKAEDLDFIYTLLEEIYKKSIVLITNYQNWLTQLDERIRSRLQPETLEFRTYTEHETIEILKQRKTFAFVPNAWKEDAFLALARKAAELKDIRVGLSLMKAAGQHAEDAAKKFIDKEDVEHATSSLAVNKDKDLVDDEQALLDLIKNNSGKKIGELYELFKPNDDISYKTFQRRIKKLEENSSISVEKKTGGEGNTSLIYFGQKKLDEF